MRFTKPPMSHDEQVDLLISRGMQIDDRSRAVHYLSHLNNYCLGAYMMDIITSGHYWKERLGELFTRHLHESARSMGFPADWCDLPVWHGKVGDAHPT